MKENYFLPKDYKPNKTNITMESEDVTYWTKERIHKSRIYQYYVYLIAKEIKEKREISTIIDVGCGTGLKLKMLTDNKSSIFGVDQESAIDFCRKNLSFGTWIVDDIEKPNNLSKLPKADMVICADVIEHLPDPDKLFEYIDSILKPEGILILSTPERDNLRGNKNRKPKNPVHIREWNNEELRKYISSKGYTLQKQKLTFPVKISLTKPFFMEVYKALKSIRSPFNNQIMVAKK